MFTTEIKNQVINAIDTYVSKFKLEEYDSLPMPYDKGLQRALYFKVLFLREDLNKEFKSLLLYALCTEKNGSDLKKLVKTALNDANAFFPLLRQQQYSGVPKNTSDLTTVLETIYDIIHSNEGKCSVTKSFVTSLEKIPNNMPNELGPFYYNSWKSWQDGLQNDFINNLTPRDFDSSSQLRTCTIV